MPVLRTGRAAALSCVPVAGAADRGQGLIVQLTPAPQEGREALRQAEMRLKLAHDAAGVGTFDWVIKANEAHGNAELLDILGLHPGEFGGTYEDWIATIHPEDLQGAVHCIEEAMETGTLEGQWRVIRPGETVIWVLARGIVERDVCGRPLRLTGAQVDITERVETEQKVEVLLAELDVQIEHLRRGMGSRGA